MELMLPSFSTTNSTNTFPPMPISAHLAGYLKFFLSHLFKSPLKRGIFSTVINGRSLSPGSSPSSSYPLCQSVALPVKEPFVFSLSSTTSISFSRSISFSTTSMKSKGFTEILGSGCEALCGTKTGRTSSISLVSTGNVISLASSW